MNVEDLREFCLSLKGVTESFPFDDVTLVFKVMNKMFCLVSLDGELSINIKNHPEKIIQQREEYPTVKPGYHMNKTHWNTVFINGSIQIKLIKNWIVESYDIIVAGLPKKKQQELKDL